MATMHYCKIGLIALSTILALFSPAFPLNFSELLILHAIAQTTNNTHSDKTPSANSASVVRIIDYFAQESQFKGHNGSVNSASFSPDSKLIVTASADKTVRVWDFSGKQLAELVGHQNSVKSAKFFDDLRGLGSALALTPSVEDNGLLSAEEILKLKLNADLVVLSACDTGRGRITGDGVIGLSRSFISAGVPSIVVSLWSVGDNSTAFLMTEFYKNMQQNLDKATALRKAMLATKEKYSNPLQWAAFTLIGEAQ